MTVRHHLPTVSPSTALGGGRLGFKSSHATRSFFTSERPRFRTTLNAPCAQQSESQADGDAVAAEFARVVNEREAAGLATSRELQVHRCPSHLLSPIRAVASVLNALQRNDWPEPDAGIETAFSFTKPWRDGEQPVQRVQEVRSWGAMEAWLDSRAFSQQLHSLPYSVLLECEDWHANGPLLFPSRRTESKAVQAVAVLSKGRQYNFSFCMEREEAGGMKGCWLVAGVRQGDYSV